MFLWWFPSAVLYRSDVRPLKEALWAVGTEPRALHRHHTTCLSWSLPAEGSLAVSLPSCGGSTWNQRLVRWPCRMLTVRKRSQILSLSHCISQNSWNTANPEIPLPFPNHIDRKINLLGSERSSLIRSADSTWIFVFQLLSLQEVLAIRHSEYHGCAEDVWNSYGTTRETVTIGLCVEITTFLPNVGTVIKYSFGVK